MVSAFPRMTPGRRRQFSPKRTAGAHLAFLAGLAKVKKIAPGMYKFRIPPTGTLDRVQAHLTATTAFAAPPPAGAPVVVLVYKCPAGIDADQYMHAHLKRVQLQATMAQQLRSVARPILSGVLAHGHSASFVVFVDPAAFPSILDTRHVNPTLFAELEHAFMDVWKFGVEFTRLNPRTVLVKGLQVLFTDMSSVSQLPRWRQQPFQNPQPRYESLYAASMAADAVLLRKLYGTLPPRSDPVQRDALVDFARAGVWKTGESMS